MAIGNQSLTLNIIADDRVLKRVLADAKRNVSTFSKEVETAGKRNQLALGGAQGAGFFGRGSKGNQALRGVSSGIGLGSAALFGSGAFIGAAVSAAALQKTIKAASDLNEQITKSERVFGASDSAIQEWSKNTAKNIGISREAALQAAGTFGNLFKAQGFSNTRNSQLSRQLVQLASDLASFNNVNPTQVLEDLNSAIVGEIEPVRKYGVDLRVARVQQEALAETGKATIKQLTQQELTLARLKILFKDTSAAQGDYQRTAGGLANTQRRLTAEVQDLEAELGNLLLPAVTEIAGSLAELAHGAVIATKELNKLAHVKIPKIKIPFFFDFPGGDSLSKGAFGISWSDSLIDVIARLFDEGAQGHTQDLANEFSRSINKLTKNALDIAGNEISKKAKPKGFGSGLTPEDLFGPLVTQLPNRLRESLLDAQNKNASPRDIIAILQRQRDSILKALEDPRLKIGQRISLKDTLKGINDAIDSANQDIVQAGKDASSKRQAALDKAAQAAQDAKDKQRQGFDNLIDALSFKIDQASLTRGFADDLKRNTELQDAIKAQIKVEGQTTELMRKLSDARQARQQILRDQTQAKQFAALGLSPTGDKPIPGIPNLKKQLAQLTQTLGPNVGTKIGGQLDRIGAVLSGKFGKVTDTTREKIRDLFETIRTEFNRGTSGPLTKTTSLNTNKILQGLGLDPTAAKELKARLSNFNSAGIALAGGGVVQTAGKFPVPVAGTGIVVNVELDGQKVAKSVTVRQQKRARSNPAQKRGPAGGI